MKKLRFSVSEHCHSLKIDTWLAFLLSIFYNQTTNYNFLKPFSVILLDGNITNLYLVFEK